MCKRGLRVRKIRLLNRFVGQSKCFSAIVPGLGNFQLSDLVGLGNGMVVSLWVRVLAG